jgi:uncharacterized protein
MQQSKKKIPLRKCVATQEQLPKKDLVRIVKNNEGKVFIDLSGKQNGRGAYLKKSEAALKLAIERNALGRALECEIPSSIYEELAKLVK